MIQKNSDKGPIVIMAYDDGKFDGKNIKVVKEILPILGGYHVAYTIKNNCENILEFYFSPE